MSDAFGFGLPRTITHEWTFASGQGPLTTDVDGRPMLVSLVQVILDGKRAPLDIVVRGQRAKPDGTRDRRCSYGTSEPYDGWVHQAIAEQFGSLKRTGQL